MGEHYERLMQVSGADLCPRCGGVVGVDECEDCGWAFVIGPHPEDQRTPVSQSRLDAVRRTRSRLRVRSNLICPLCRIDMYHLIGEGRYYCADCRLTWECVEDDEHAPAMPTPDSGDYATPVGGADLTTKDRYGSTT